MNYKWHVIEYKETRALCIVNENDNPIADLWRTGDDKNDQNVANLMAAAPDMLRALKGVMNLVAESLGDTGYYPDKDNTDWNDHPEMQLAEAAIAKAKGEA